MHFTLWMFYRWTYSDDSVTLGVPYSGKVAYYGAGGYYFDFPDQQFVARAFIKDELEYKTWLDRQTRAVFVDFTIYISNMNAVCVGKYETPVITQRLKSRNYILTAG